MIKAKMKNKCVDLWQRRKPCGALAAADDMLSYTFLSTYIAALRFTIIAQYDMHQSDIIKSNADWNQDLIVLANMLFNEDIISV